MTLAAAACPTSEAVVPAKRVAQRVGGSSCGPAAQRRPNGVAFPADNKDSDVLLRLLEVLPCGLRRLWDGALAPVTLAQSPARQYLAEKI
eukprot:scaffold53980_cov34-Phaeocystis_antarctica.AAC.1